MLLYTLSKFCNTFTPFCREFTDYCLRFLSLCIISFLLCSGFYCLCEIFTFSAAVLSPDIFINICQYMISVFLSHVIITSTVNKLFLIYCLENISFTANTISFISSPDTSTLTLFIFPVNVNGGLYFLLTESA